VAGEGVDSEHDAGDLILEPPEPEEVADWDGLRCISCRRPMKHGTRFCVDCGHHNFDADQLVGRSLASQAEEHLRNRAALENMNSLWPSWFVRWWYWFFR
jgi:hypothetical protein